MDPISIVVVSLIFSAFFSGIEIAYVSSNKLQIELQKKQGAITAKALSFVTHKPSKFITTTLTGNTFMLVVYGYYMAVLLEPYMYAYLPPFLNFDAMVLVAQTVISTLIVLFTAEFLPKSLFLLNPNTLLNFFAIPMLVIYVILYPLVWVIDGLAKSVLRNILKLDYSDDRPVFGLTDLNYYVQATFQASEKQEQMEVDAKIFHNALEFKTVKVRDCMIPRTEIIAVDIEDGMPELKKAFIESGHSKIIVYRDSIDDVIGYCHSTELFKKPENIKNILNDIIIVPETALANELMIKFITAQKSLALVVDEFGGTAGIVSIEDIIEEIFGEINDEHDVDDLLDQQINENTWMLSGRHEIDYLNDKYNWDLPTGDFETLGGLILSITEELPQLNEEIEVDKFRIIIKSKDEARILHVQLTIDSES